MVRTMEQTEQTMAIEPAEQEAHSRPPVETVRLQPTRGFSRVLPPRELWRYRDLAYQIAARDVTVRYRQTALGAAWAVLQPVGFMIVFSLIFGRLAGISSDGIPYALFSLAGLVPWTFFTTVLTAFRRQPRGQHGARLEDLLPPHLHPRRGARRRPRRPRRSR